MCFKLLEYICQLSPKFQSHISNCLLDFSTKITNRHYKLNSFKLWLLICPPSKPVLPSFLTIHPMATQACICSHQLLGTIFRLYLTSNVWEAPVGSFFFWFWLLSLASRITCLKWRSSIVISFLNILQQLPISRLNDGHTPLLYCFSPYCILWCSMNMICPIEVSYAHCPFIFNSLHFPDFSCLTSMYFKSVSECYLINKNFLTFHPSTPTCNQHAHIS